MGGLLMGGFEPVAKPWGMQGIPENFQNTQLQEDWDQFQIFMDNAVKRVSAIEDAEVNSLTMLPESFTPELGWELCISTEFSNNVFDTLMEKGEKFNLKLVGLHALDSLRLEKGYKHWSADITPDHTPYEAGLGFCVKPGKPAFIGQKALADQKVSDLKRKLVMFSIQDPEPLVYYGEPIYRDGELVSENTHGAYSQRSMS